VPASAPVASATPTTTATPVAATTAAATTAAAAPVSANNDSFGQSYLKQEPAYNQTSSIPQQPHQQQIPQQPHQQQQFGMDHLTSAYNSYLPNQPPTGVSGFGMNPMASLPDYGIYSTEAQRAAAMVSFIKVFIRKELVNIHRILFNRAIMILQLLVTLPLLLLLAHIKPVISIVKMLSMVKAAKAKLSLNNKCILPICLITNTTTCLINLVLTNNLPMVSLS
jgi:hypothetical protein